MNTCCAPPSASGSPEAGTRWSFSPLLLVLLFFSYPHHQPVIYPSISPLHVPFLLFSSLLLPPCPCRQSAVIEQAFHRHSHWDWWPHQRAGSQRVQVPPVRAIPHISAYLIQERGHGGVESPRLRLSHYQTVPHQRCHHMAIDFWKREQSQWKTSEIQVSLLPQLCNVAVEQCGGRDQIRKERSEEEGAFNKWRFVRVCIYDH